VQVGDLDPSRLLICSIRAAAIAGMSSFRWRSGAAGYETRSSGSKVFPQRLAVGSPHREAGGGGDDAHITGISTCRLIGGHANLREREEASPESRIGISPISSSSKVPRSACSKHPIRRSTRAGEGAFLMPE